MNKLYASIAAALLLAACGGKEEPAPVQPAVPAPAAEETAPKPEETRFTPPATMPSFTPAPAMPVFNARSVSASGGNSSAGTGYTPVQPAAPSSPAPLPAGTPPPPITPMPAVTGPNVSMPPLTRTVNPDGSVTMSIKPPTE